jgi:hypothetical protein
MASKNKNLTNSYQIILKGHLKPTWGNWFDGMQVLNLPNGQVKIYGPIKDQAMLHGLLIKIRDLGLPLISLNRVPAENGKKIGEIQI